MDLRILLLSANGCAPAYAAWVAALEREGVPYDAVIAGPGHPPIDARLLTAAGDHARYQAVVVATGGLPNHDGTRFVSALSAEEWAALADFERAFAIRRITAFAYPSPQHGLETVRSGSTAGLTGRLTAAGARVFGELRGPVPIDANAYGHLARPLGDEFETLVAGPQDSALLGVYTHPEDGREDMVCTVDGNAAMLHVQLLRHGMLRWVTRGAYVGHARHHLAVQVDDVFLSDDSWDPEERRTVPAEIRMTAQDADAAAEWSRDRGLRLDLVFNGHGAQPEDPLTEALLRSRDAFGWINHTYSHYDLDGADAATLRTEVRRNVVFAEGHGLEIDRGELVTGEHSGLGHPDLPDALAETGVRWVAADNSRDPVQRPIGPAHTVPRHPTNLYFNVCTRAALLDEHQHLLAVRAGRVERARAAVRLAIAITWEQFVDGEVTTMLGHVLANDPRPHYVHQSNLAGERIAFDLLDRLLQRHRELFRCPLNQPSLAGAGEELARQSAWSDALARRQVVAHIRDGEVHVRSGVGVRVPLTGVAGLTGDGASGWTSTIGPEDGDVAFALD